MPNGSELRATSNDSSRPRNSSEAAGKAEIGVLELALESGTQAFYPNQGQAPKRVKTVFFTTQCSLVWCGETLLLACYL